MKNTEREGVSAVQNIVYNDLGWTFREQPVDDYGIDAEIEVADQIRPTGKVIAAQIKSGNSYFQNSTKENIIFYLEERHKRYWLKHVLPVIVLLYHPISKECIWEVVNEFTVKQTEKGYKIIIPKTNQFGRPTKEKLLILAYYKNIKDLAEEIDDLDVDKESLFAMLDEQQKKVFRKTREVFDKKNAAADRLPFEYHKEELFDFINTISWSNAESDIIFGNQYMQLITYVEQFINGSKTNTLIILGEAGIGKTTLVKAVIRKFEEFLFLYIQPRHYENIFDIMQNEYKLNNKIQVIIIDGWDELESKRKQNTWHNIVTWQNSHKDIKIIITSRYRETNIWENADFVTICPLSQVEAVAFLKVMTGKDFSCEESVIKLISIFNTPLMLKMLVEVTSRNGISLEGTSIDDLISSIILHYPREDSQILESIAFKMMQENKMSISSRDNKYLDHLDEYTELHVEKDQISFKHMAFYEIFAARYIFQHIFKEGKGPKEFSVAVWDIFSNNLCSINILNYLKYIIKHEKIGDTFLAQLNYNFSYLLEGMRPESPVHNTTVFKAISNVFYTVWHIVSYVNRIYYGIFKPSFSKENEPNLSCLINVFNRIYFNEIYLDFSCTDLSYIKLWRCNLTNMNFKHSKLCHTNFLGSCMEGSNFQQADLSYSNLVAADLRHAYLENAVLTGANVSNCMIAEDSLKYFLPYRDTLRHANKLIIFMNDGTIKHFFDI